MIHRNKNKKTTTTTGELEKQNDDVFMSVPIPRSVSEMASSVTEVEALERKLRRGDLDSTTVHALKEMLKVEEEHEVVVEGVVVVVEAG